MEGFTSILFIAGGCGYIELYYWFSLLLWSKFLPEIPSPSRWINSTQKAPIHLLNKENRLTLTLAALLIFRFYCTSSLDFIYLSYLSSAEDEVCKTERDLLSHGVQHFYNCTKLCCGIPFVNLSISVSKLNIFCCCCFPLGSHSRTSLLWCLEICF